MSRGGRAATRGGFGARGGFGTNNPPPMGLTFADVQAMSREQSALYPPLESLPVLTEYSEEEKRICELQLGFAARLRKSAYYVTEVVKSTGRSFHVRAHRLFHCVTELERYADKYRPAATLQPKLERRNLHQPFFPQEVFEAYFDSKKKRKGRFFEYGTTLFSYPFIAEKKAIKRINLDDLEENAEEEVDKSEASDAGSQVAEEDYDVDEEYDNDYADNYFDNGEGDDFDDLGGGGGDPSGGGFDYD
ncbi:DNA-directed RNA polymerase III, subunit Rpc31 [Lactarius psammicola]|nr:DNA-directed RNA polymerase III, subunit Rpc31 [Lactarius psammicola]